MVSSLPVMFLNNISIHNKVDYALSYLHRLRSLSFVCERLTYSWIHSVPFIFGGLEDRFQISDFYCCALVLFTKFITLTIFTKITSNRIEKRNITLHN